MKPPANILIKFLINFLMFAVSGIAQIVVTPGPDVTPEEMVEKIVGPGIQYSNVTFQGVDIARGTFSNGSSTNLGIESGILLTNGSLFLFPGPNNSYSAGQNNGLNAPGPWWGSVFFDPSILSFDVIPDSDTIKLKYVFGSEEYNEWVGTTFNDQFGIFISGPNPSGGNYNEKNIALVPDTNIEVKINNVNNGYAPPGVIPTGPCTNCEYFVDNTNGTTLQYDAFTTVMTAIVHVVPCETYHLTLVIMDAGDGIYDSGLAIEENSLTSPGTRIETSIILTPPGLSENLVEGHVEGDILFVLPDDSLAPITVNFDLSLSYANPQAYPDGDFQYEIPQSITFEEGQDTAILHIAPVNDGIIEGEENLTFIIANNFGCEVTYDTAIFFIEDYQNMYPFVSPDQVQCPGDITTLNIELMSSGYPPFAYMWEPGGYTTSTITVSPEVTTTYTVTVTDYFEETVVDSVTVTVVPDNLNEMLAFSFNAAINPELPFDATGQIYPDSIYIALPVSVNPENLVATFNASNCALTYSGGILQQSGITPNDFSNLVIYTVVAQNGDEHEWMVYVDLVSGNFETAARKISVFPNPATHRLSIINASDFECTVLNTIGNELYSDKINRSEYVLDVSALENGIYFLKLQQQEKVIVKRVVVFR